jgi:uncharacterized protein (TIGR02594 family)
MNRIEACQKIHDVAIAELGVHETPGKDATARIIVYNAHTTLKATSDEVSWCSSFVNFGTDIAGFPGTHSAAARSWLDWGVKLDVPIKGCIVVFERKDPLNPNAAHVAICDYPDISNGIIRVCGGNQSDKVSITRYPVAKVLGYRAPL